MKGDDMILVSVDGHVMRQLASAILNPE